MAIDLAVQLLRHGYEALPRLWDRADDLTRERDAIAVRLLGRRALVVRGAEGARQFYDSSLVRRSGVMPAPLASLLFGSGAVHGLDGEEHLRRKQMFLDCLGGDQVAALGERVDGQLVAAAQGWPPRVPMSIFDELVRIYGSSVLEWAGVAVERDEAGVLSRRLAQIVDGFGFAPGAYPRAWAARVRLNRWATQVVSETREGLRQPPVGTVLHTVALDAGSDLPPDVAGVELLNVLRPTVAVAWLGTFAALAITEHPEAAARLRPHDAHAARRAFAEEVRRTYPFVPALAGEVIRPTTTAGHELQPGDRLVLDVIGTNHHPRRWSEPHEFLPTRFLHDAPSAYDLVPQGGGDPHSGHRCPGEGITMTLLERTLHRCARMGYSVITGPIDWTRVPSLPPHGLRLSECRPGLDADL